MNSIFSPVPQPPLWPKNPYLRSNLRIKYISPKSPINSVSNFPPVSRYYFTKAPIPIRNSPIPREPVRLNQRHQGYQSHRWMHSGHFTFRLFSPQWTWAVYLMLATPRHCTPLTSETQGLQGFAHSIRILLLLDLVHLSLPQKSSLLQLKQPDPLCASWEARFSLTYL